MNELLPTLTSINVSPLELLLDPNNPRFITHESEKVGEADFSSPAVMERIFEKMNQGDDKYEIKQLMHSIRTNGWQPIDSIFVIAHERSKFFRVLEGNRRVTAIRELLKNQDELTHEIVTQISRIEVMEVSGHEDSEILSMQIDYLLGVRHHGALKKWSPFAQAANILKTYLEKSKMTAESFVWNDEVAKNVADALSIRAEGRQSVKERLSVYRAMLSVTQLGDVSPEMMKDNYYSLFSELLTRRRKKGGLVDYISQDPDTFLIDAVSVNKLEQLCCFSVPKRINAPIANPQEWRALDNILTDEDIKKKSINLTRVVEGKEKPSVVWAQRYDELRKLEWSKWLEKIRAVVSGVRLEQVAVDDKEAQVALEKLAEVIRHLGKK